MNQRNKQIFSADHLYESPRTMLLHLERQIVHFTSIVIATTHQLTVLWLSIDIFLLHDCAHAMQLTEYAPREPHLDTTKMNQIAIIHHSKLLTNRGVFINIGNDFVHMCSIVLYSRYFGEHESFGFS